jgi:hypothetical protein
MNCLLVYDSRFYIVLSACCCSRAAQPRRVLCATDSCGPRCTRPATACMSVWQLQHLACCTEPFGSCMLASEALWRCPRTRLHLGPLAPQWGSHGPW